MASADAAGDAKDPKGSSGDSANFTVTTHYHFRYTTEEPVPIPDVIESLKSMERIIKRTPTFVEHRFDSVKVTETQVFVERLESGSLDLDFIIKFVCRTDERAERAKQLIKELTEDKGVVRDIVAVGVGSLLTIGAFQVLSPGKTDPSSTITAYQSVVIQAGQDIGFTEDQIKAAIKKIPEQKTLGKDAFNVIKPATQDPKATIDVPEMPQLSIARDIIDKMPEDYEPPAPTEKTASYDSVKVTVDASDRHNNEKGWAGSINGLVDHRVRFILDEFIDPATLHGKTSFWANITIIERYIPSRKRYEIKEVQINDIVDAPSSN
ncbi:TPA: hypothetical protein SH331_000653 [Pseudomonas aeruginosa]|uniref:hypothetical protein n=1 Tax=Pseudomonas aeruginosa TaxID=287 RepID=UPI0009BAB182|nr:hypothetical protein [Pseudomonas aeruginosa]ARC79605.1 hypothetical protein AXW93_12345 [Pseudomonas aeruginosa]MCT5494928.1 hypothetical protein [Pseudomonas aeruginosa]MCT5537286.1 hypothetical protein [Pseudomonas aeruginosa]MDP5489915.1 hypothetical protein [Pseudomonas aeruginosa]MDP5656745.1 hypothetical protein [Pseudomonas aeruginosa]